MQTLTSHSTLKDRQAQICHRREPTEATVVEMESVLRITSFSEPKFLGHRTHSPLEREKSASHAVHPSSISILIPDDDYIKVNHL